MLQRGYGEDRLGTVVVRLSYGFLIPTPPAGQLDVFPVDSRILDQPNCRHPCQLCCVLQSRYCLIGFGKFAAVYRF